MEHPRLPPLQIPGRRQLLDITVVGNPRPPRPLFKIPSRPTSPPARRSTKLEANRFPAKQLLAAKAGNEAREKACGVEPGNYWNQGPAVMLGEVVRSFSHRKSGLFAGSVVNASFICLVCQRFT